MADSQAGGRAVPAQVSQAPAASHSCCFPPEAPLRGGDPLFSGQEGMPPSPCGHRRETRWEELWRRCVPHLPVFLTGLL